MAVNTDKMRKDRDTKASERGIGNWFRPKQPGEYLLYICPPPRDDMDTPYVEVFEHFSVGKGDGKKVACLDLDKNEILTDDRVYVYIEGGQDTVDGGCPICESLENASDREKREKGRRRSFLFNVFVLGYRKELGRGEWTPPERSKEVQTFAASTTVWEGITDVFLAEGDITNPKEAIYVKLHRTGTGQTDTRYKVSADTVSLRNPVALTKEQRRVITEALAPGGSGDLFKLATATVKSREKIEALMEGVDLEDTDDADDDAPPARGKGPPKCFKLDYGDDDECAVCPHRSPCSKHLKRDLFEGHELKEGDIDYEPPARRPRREPNPETTRRRDVADDEDETPPPRRARKAEADEEPPPARGSRSRAPVDEDEPPARARSGKPKNDEEPSPRKPQKEPEPEPDDTDSEEAMKKLGLDARQILRINADGMKLVLKHKLKGEWISVLKNGDVVVIQEKLPDGHALKEDDEEPEIPPTRRGAVKPPDEDERPEEKPRAEKERTPPTPARRAVKPPEEDEQPEEKPTARRERKPPETPAGRRGTVKPPDEDERPEEKPRAEKERAPPPADDDDETPTDSGGDLDLDSLERELASTANKRAKTTTKK